MLLLWARCDRLGVIRRYSCWFYGGRAEQGKRDINRKKTERKDDRPGQMCPFQLSGAEILALDLTGCLTPASVSVHNDHLKLAQARNGFLVTGFELHAVELQSDLFLFFLFQRIYRFSVVEKNLFWMYLPLDKPLFWNVSSYTGLSVSAGCATVVIGHQLQHAPVERVCVFVLFERIDSGLPAMQRGSVMNHGNLQSLQQEATPQTA